MQTEQTRSETQTNSTGASSVTVCPNCAAQMPSEMRFCRSCGFRLGEGVAEFTETVRFQNPPTAATQAKATAEGAAPAFAKASPKWNACAGVNDWGALAKDVEKAVKSAAKHFEQKHLEQKQLKQQQQLEKPRRRRSHWMGWLIMIIIISVVSSGGFIGASGLRGLRERLRGLSGSATSAKRSWVGVDEFQTTNGGVTFEKVEPAGSPADKAGLVGGDLITSFDGQSVKTADELRKLLTTTLAGKTVEVIYVRDGETRTTKLTTISKDEMERLEEAKDDRTRGYVGIGNSSERVAVPGTNISGVRLKSIRRNNPAYIAGMRDDDIVIEFDNVPIRTYDELESRTRRAVPDSTVKVVVMRGGERLEIPVKVGVDD